MLHIFYLFFYDVCLNEFRYEKFYIDSLDSCASVRDMRCHILLDYCAYGADDMPAGVAWGWVWFDGDFGECGISNISIDIRIYKADSVK
jgi:hypothetical protein